MDLLCYVNLMHKYNRSFEGYKMNRIAKTNSFYGTTVIGRDICNFTLFYFMENIYNYNLTKNNNIFIWWPCKSHWNYIYWYKQQKGSKVYKRKGPVKFHERKVWALANSRGIYLYKFFFSLQNFLNLKRSFANKCELCIWWIFLKRPYFL